MVKVDVSRDGCNGAFKDCREVIRHIMQNIPGVVLMDIDIPHLNVLRDCDDRNQFTQVRILIQMVSEDEDKLFAICAGADGYILKKTPPVN